MSYILKKHYKCESIVKYAKCSDSTHNNNPDTEDNPYGVNPDNATYGAART
jgi:hypothetical protein